METTRPGGAALRRRRLLEHIRSLSECGAGLGAIAGPVCAAARELAGGDAGSIFWKDDKGEPAGFYHETGRADLKDMYITRFDELFSGPGQENMLTLTEIVGPSVGRMITSEYLDLFRSGNVYRHLCVPLDHHSMLDVRIEVAGHGRALLLIFGKGDHRFTPADVERIRPVQAMLQRAVAFERPDTRWVRDSQDAAHFTTDLSGRQLLAIDPEAEAMLMASHLLAQNIAMLSRPRAAPAFALMLAGMLAGGATPRQALPIANGRIVATARPTRLLDGQGGETTGMYVSLAREASFDVLCIARLMTTQLSPLQRDIALFGLRGSDRARCGDEFGVGGEALKKHCARIFDALGATRWTDLAVIGDRIAADHAAAQRGLASAMTG
jgi:hypothetical protein